MTDKDIWVFLEQTNGILESASFKLLGERRRLADQAGGKLCGVVLAGRHSEGITGEFTDSGADVVYLVGADAHSRCGLGAQARLLSELIEANDCLAVLFVATRTAEDLAPRIAMRLKTGLVTRCVQLGMNQEGSLAVRRPLFGGLVHASCV